MYTLDPTLAKKADNISAYITETGKYIGKFVRAEKLVAKQKGTHGIGFTFKTDAGQETRFDVYTQKADGEPLQGLNLINQMMACLSARTLTEATMKVKKWSQTEGVEVEELAPCFPGLMNKPVGLLLRSEEYAKMKDGVKTNETAWRMGLFYTFQAGTELTATEILDRKTTPEQLPKIVAQLKDRPLKAQSAKSQPMGGEFPAGRFPDSDLSDDIPF